MDQLDTQNDHKNSCHKEDTNLKDQLLHKKTPNGNQDQVENHETKIDNCGSSDRGHKNEVNRGCKSCEEEEKVDESFFDQFDVQK